MKPISFLVGFVVYSHLVFGQPDTVYVNGLAVSVPKTQRYLDRKGSYQLANQVFSQVAVGQSGTDLSNYATFEPLNGSFKFNGFAPLHSQERPTQRPAYMSIALAGDLLSNNVGVLFTNSKLNTNVSADAKFHFALKNWRYSFFSSDKETMLEKKELLRQEEISRLKKLNEDFAKIKNDQFLLQSKKDAVEDKIAYYQDLLVKIERDLDALPSANGFETKEKLADSAIRTKTRIEKWQNEVIELNGEIVALQNNYDELFLDGANILKLRQALEEQNKTQAEIESLLRTEIYNNTEQWTEKILQEYEAKKLRLESAATITYFDMQWLTVSLGFNKKKFYTFFDSLAFDDQVEKRELDAFNMGIAYNFFSENRRKNRIYYISLGFNRVKRNNTDELSTTEVVDEKVIASAETKRKIVTKYNAFTKPLEEFRSWQASANFYYMFGKSNLSGIHLLPEFLVNDDVKNYGNFTIGYVMSFKNKKDDKAVFNIEAFIKFKDVSNALDSDLAFIKRNEIAVSFGLPFQIIKP